MRSHWARVDPTWWLMQHAHHWHPRPARHEHGSKVGGGDTVDDHDVWTQSAGFRYDMRTMQRRPWKASVLHRDEPQRRAVCGGQLSQPMVIQIPASQPGRITQGYQDCA